MNPDLSRSFKDIVHGLLTSQFNVEVRSARFKDVLICTIGQFIFLIVSTLILGDMKIAFILIGGLVFTGLTYLYHIKTDIKRVDLKATFFIVIFTGFFLPILFYYCGQKEIGAAFLQTEMYFASFFILKVASALLLAIFSTGAWLVIFKYYDYFAGFGLDTDISYETSSFFTVATFLMAVITIGSLIGKTIGAYDNEQKKAKELFDNYNKQLYKLESGNAYNDRFLLSSVATLGVLTEKGDIKGFTAVMLSIDNIDVINNLTKEADEKTFDVFSRKIFKSISEDEVFVRQEKNSFALVLKTVDVYEVEDRLNEILATINMTIFEYLPKDRLTLSAGYCIHTASASVTTTMQNATNNMLTARKKGGNCAVGGNS